MGLGFGLSGREPAAPPASEASSRSEPRSRRTEAAPAAAQAGTVTAELAGDAIQYRDGTGELQLLSKSRALKAPSYHPRTAAAVELANIRGLGLSPSDEYPHQFLWGECRDVEERTIA